MNSNVIDTVNQLRLKRESKTLPQLHGQKDMTELSPPQNYFSQTNTNTNIVANLSSANEEIKQLKQELNLKNNQLS